MKNILLPIDGSECAMRSVALVISKLSHYRSPENTQIHLVNIQPPLPHDVSRFVSHDQIADFHRDESDKAMQEAKKRLDTAGLKYTCHAKVGDVAEEITLLAENIGCDQIVMGTHGRGALGDFLMGSITLKVLHLAKIPVLLVK